MAGGSPPSPPLQNRQTPLCRTGGLASGKSKRLNVGSSALGSPRSLFLGVSKVWIQPCLGRIQSLRRIREVPSSHPCPRSKSGCSRSTKALQGPRMAEGKVAGVLIAHLQGKRGKKKHCYIQTAVPGAGSGVGMRMEGSCRAWHANLS